MSRNYEQHPEVFPSPAVVVADYDPDTDGWTADACAELKAAEDAVADYCGMTLRTSA